MTRRRRHFLTLASSLLLGSALHAGPAAAIEAGQAAPDLALTGASVPRLSALKGKLVYLDFWASWCGPCQKSFPWMNAMQAKYAAQGLQVLAINLDAKRADADEFLARNPAQFALAFDAQGDSAKRLGVKGMPTSVLLDADGKVLFVHQGFHDEDRAALEARLVQALPRSAAATPSTASAATHRQP
jgi:cytochrome c biogenesis protein CcmG, thiol:disulfide interchange protein DsbE